MILEIEIDDDRVAILRAAATVNGQSFSQHMESWVDSIVGAAVTMMHDDYLERHQKKRGYAAVRVRMRHRKRR